MAKKRNKISVPKRIGGVKVPKTARRALKDVMASKQGRQMVAQAVMAAGAAVVGATQAKRGSAVRRFADDHAPSSPKAVDEVAGLPSALAFAVGEATRAFTDALSRGKAVSDAKTAWPEVSEDEAAPAAKKKPSTPEELH